VDTTAYLRRIHYEGQLAPTIETLRGLHLAHMMAVPFENLDIPLGHPIVLDEQLLYEKIVGRSRGGFCYELNGLFAALLSSLGFRVTRLSARVYRPATAELYEFDHLVLLVELPQPSESRKLDFSNSAGSWLADVGFGDSYTEPLRFVADLEHSERGSTYRLTREGDCWVMSVLQSAGWKKFYQFTLTPHALADFAGMCHYHQTSPESPFTTRRICSRALSDGRITLANMRLIIFRGGVRQEQLLQSEEEYRAALRDHFGVVL